MKLRRFSGPMQAGMILEVEPVYIRRWGGYDQLLLFKLSEDVLMTITFSKEEGTTREPEKQPVPYH